MAGRGGRRGRGGARGVRDGTISKHSMQLRSSDGAGEPKAKRSKEEAVCKDFSDLLAQPAEILVQIINYLDPKALRELAFSCQYLFNFCRKSKGIHVIFPVKIVWLDGFNVKYRQKNIRIDLGSLFGDYLKKLFKWPLSFHIDKASIFHGMMWDEILALKPFFVEIGVKKIRIFILNLALTVQDLENFTTEFVKVFGIEAVLVYRLWPEEMVEAVLKMPLTELNLMNPSAEEVNVDLLLNCSIPILKIESKITLAGILVQIINYLDPKSLRELAFSCQALFNFCREAKGIHVVFPVAEVWLDVGRNCNSIKYKQQDIGYKEPGLFEDYLKKLFKWPFFIHIDQVTINTRPSWDEMMVFKAFLVQNGVKKIRSFKTDGPLDVEQVENFTTEFVKVFGIETIYFTGIGAVWTRELFEACLRMPLTKLELTSHFHEDLHVDLLLNCSIPILKMDDYTQMTLACMETIIQMWTIRNGLQQWKFCAEDFNPNDFKEYFNLRHKVLPFDYKGPIDRTNPSVFMEEKESDERKAISFYLLRRDGKLLCVCLNYSIEFRLCPIEKGPLALRTL